MKRTLITVIIIVIVATSVLLFVTSRKCARMNPDLISHPLPADSTLNGQMLLTCEMPTTSETQRGHITETLSQNASVASQALVVASTLPTGLVYTATTTIEHVAPLAHILYTISNAVTTANNILKTKCYSVVTQFDRSVWFEVTDKPQATVWRIVPYRTTPVVAAIQASVYRDETLTEEDPARSFNIDFIPETGDLRMFWWDDRHEILNVRTNDMAVEYARHLEGKKRLVVVWDRNGNLVSSNVYDWAARGRVIGGASQLNRTPCRFGSTSAVEAATESWRQKVE